MLADDDDLTRARFRLAPGVPDVLVEQTSAAYLGGMALAAASAYSVMPQLLSAFGTGAGVAYSDYGEDAVEAQAALNRPAFIHSLASEWIPAIPDVAARFADTTTPARVADVGCGLGWSSIELARAFPHVIVDGYDADESSIARARRNAEDAGVADRVSFHLVDASSGYGSGDYDLVVFFECVHDMAHPDAVLAAARDAVSADGAVIVMDERTADRLTPGDPVETFFATISVLWCLPQGRVDADSRDGRHGHAHRPLPRDRPRRRLVRRRRPRHRPPVLPLLPPRALTRVGAARVRGSGPGRRRTPDVGRCVWPQR